MDPVTVFVIAALMMLANGGVLGLMHADLPLALRPAAVSWRVATLLIAGGCIMFSVQRYLPLGFVLPLANGLVMLGFAGYWRSIRQFYGKPDSWLLLLPVLIGTFTVFYFTAISPNIGPRILIVSVAWLVLMGGSVLSLRSQANRDAARSRRVMGGIYVTVMAFVALRLVYYLVIGFRPGLSVLDPSWMNVLTPMIAAILPVVGTSTFLLMCSERIRRQWERAASTDYLTGLANRRTFSDAAEERFTAARAKGTGLALAVVDVDHFKAINDNYGHQVGDVALKHIARTLQLACRERELPARHGGEEFAVLLEGVDAAGAATAGERLRQAVEANKLQAGELSIPITVSVGVALLSEADDDVASLLRRADAALYAAKAGGRNRVELAA